jgi:BirA family transcriptional regulator, biotin operon repressor / biotin---[acetyl-CoA-carboxylase] ligase
MADSVARAYMNPPIRFEHVAEVDSTNAALMGRPFAASPGAPVLLLADRQTAGRGRHGRRWLSDPEGSLTMSIGYERTIGSERLLGLSLAIGVALADELALLGARPLLKWPNDVYCPSPQQTDAVRANYAKAGGILVEARQQATVRRIVVGCGLNLRPSDAVSAAEAGQPVAALFPSDRTPDRVALARSLGAAIVVALDSFLEDGFAPFAARWRELDWLEGSRIDVQQPDGTRVTGVARGVDADGALRVETAGAVVALVSGEASVRRS